MVVDTLLPHEAAIVEGLRNNGVYITDFDRLGLSADEATISNSCREVAAQLTERAAALGGRLPDMMTSAPEDLLRHPEIFRWGLNAAILRVVEAYLCQPVAYDGPLIFHTPANGKEVGTRKWHLDREDVSMIKVGLYLNEVDEDGGPLQILKHAEAATAGRFNYCGMTMSELEKRLGGKLTPQDVFTCTGRSGTLVFADTARFYHRGKPATGRNRSAAFFSYVARTPRHPFFCERSRLSRGQILQLTDGLHPVQQATALWRDDLSLAARIMPSCP